jgi:methanethiol S-methyltransferase
VKKLLFAVYGMGCYVIFLAAVFWGIAFTGGFVPETFPAATIPPLPALLVDLALLSLFGLQHSVMARASFKRRWTRIVPQPIERSTYVLLASLALLLLFWQWQPLPGVVWSVANPTGVALIRALFGLGWLLALVSTFLIDHFALGGLRQVWEQLRGGPTAPAPFRTPSLYRVVRHPMMLGLLIAFWATPHMTAGRLIFALGMTAYILVGVSYEERDLLRAFGAAYRAYRAQVPMLIPVPRLGMGPGRGSQESGAGAAAQER